ncbi:MAG: DegT/DnrJ/EryC1/StrS family aminotransferase [Thermodesulfobacteriota bacterium]
MTAPATALVDRRARDAARRGRRRTTWLPYHRPSIGEEEIAEVVDTLRSGWITSGEKVHRFEHDFAELLGVPDALAVSSGTAALHLAMLVNGIQPDDEVIVPTYTFTASAEAVTYVGARPVLVDVDPVTCNATADTIARAIGPRTRAVVVVHIAGQPCSMDPIRTLCDAHGLKIVEDAAHALPAMYRGRYVGTLGDAAAFSFYATKNVTTGEGGMLTASAALLAEARVLACHAISRDAWKRYREEGTWYYEVVGSGCKYNLSDIHASLGIHQLRKLGEFHALRRHYAALYERGFADLDAVVTPRETPGTLHAWHLYLLRLVPQALRIDRNRFIEELRARKIGTSVHFIPLHLHPYYQEVWGYRPGDFPHAEEAYRDTISLPLYPGMAPSDVDDVVEAVRDVVAAHRR